MPYPNCRRAMPSLPRGRQARHPRPLVASVFTAASNQTHTYSVHRNELPVVSSQLRPRRGDRSPPPTPRTTAGRPDPRPTRGGSRRRGRPGRRPSRDPRCKGAATVYEQRPIHVFFRKGAHTCPRDTSRAPRARRARRPRKTPVCDNCGCSSEQRGHVRLRDEFFPSLRPRSAWFLGPSLSVIDRFDQSGASIRRDSPAYAQTRPKKNVELAVVRH